jgi:hypothetical protein
LEHTLHIDCPPELLISLHQNAESFSRWVKWQAALALYKEGKISSGMAAGWLGMPRAVFLLKAMENGAELLEDSVDDISRETALL